ncbi:hypothetical protein DAPPUDRAFT_327140 [Daphnia pulex]|uniref:Uncharacterized protein n=1 Tax=Daphnia pulex TaxID=6669 RepID=E9H9Y3_DAPPU|nr:hypothetical protein DAPPUDRAFT_327140 [Daphnia pulex]|eukprot:EFX71533.1 hypothetical protein DAPPUDRAFT_327140 [Daphnia pulex]
MGKYSLSIGHAAVRCCIVMAKATTGVPISSGYGGCQTATPPPYYKTKSTYATSTYYTEAPKYYTTELSDPAYYTDALKYYSAPSYYQTKA